MRGGTVAGEDAATDRRAYMPWLYPLWEYLGIAVCIGLLFAVLAGVPGWICLVALFVLFAGGALFIAYMSDTTEYVLYGDRLEIERPIRPQTVTLSDISGVWLCPALFDMRAQYADARNMIKIALKDGTVVRLYMRHPDELYREIRVRAGLGERPGAPTDRIA